MKRILGHVSGQEQMKRRRVDPAKVSSELSVSK